MGTMGSEAEEVFNEISSQPALKKAYIINSDEDFINIQSVWEQKFIGHENLTTFTRNISIKISDEVIKWISSPPSEVCYQKLRKNFGEYTAILSTIPSQKKTKDYLEVWNTERKICSWDLSLYSEFGNVYTDDCFGFLEWDNLGRHVIFNAEKSKTGEKDSKEHKCNDDEENTLYLQNWGEELFQKHQSVLCYFDILEGTVSVLELPGMSCGHAAYSVFTKSIIGIAWKHQPHRLGLIYCKNRESVLYTWSKDTDTYKILLDAGVCVFSLSMSLDGKSVFYLQNEAEGPHQQTSKLMKMNLESLEIQELVPILDEPTTTTNEGIFTGLYCEEFPPNCNLQNDVIVFNSVVHNHISPFLLDLCTGSIFSTRVLLNDDEQSYESIQVIDCTGSYILASKSNVLSPATLILGKVTKNNGILETEWFSALSVENSKAVGNILSLKFLDGSDDFPYYGLYIQPTIKPQALIVYPHGGPHSVSVNTFDPISCSFVALGYGVLLINFKGSLGNGENCVRALCGKVGQLDVENVYNATQVIISKFELDSSRLLLFGGSHGGFIVTHLIGQFPDTFKACVARNPVTDISTMLAGTDIPDWCYSVLDMKYFPKSPPGLSMQTEAFNRSPIAHISKVKTPTLLLIGDKDLRVPPYQGYSYYYYLKSRGINCRLHHFEDSHGLRKPATLKNCFINTCAWFNEYLPV